MATWISPGVPPLAFSSQAIMSLRPAPPWANFRCPTFVPVSSCSETTCSCDAQSTPANHFRCLCIMHSPLIGHMAHANNSSLAATPACACTGALRRISPLGVDHGRFTGAQVLCRRSPTRLGAGGQWLLPANQLGRERYQPFVTCVDTRRYPPTYRVKDIQAPFLRPGLRSDNGAARRGGQGWPGGIKLKP